MRRPEGADWSISPWVAYWGAAVDNKENGRRVGKLVLQGSTTGGVYLGSWTDTSPLTSGAYLSLRTTSSEARFDDPSPGSGQAWWWRSRSSSLQ